MEALNTHSNLSREKAFSTCEDFVELYNTAPPSALHSQGCDTPDGPRS